MYVRNLDGEEFPLQATHTHDLELNGNQQLSFTVLPTKVNNQFIEDITEMWETVDDDDVEYKIIYAKKRGEGNRLTVQVKAIPLFFDDFDTLRIYEEYNQSMTANAFFTMVFADTDYNVVLNGTFHAVTWEGLGRGETRLEMFKKGLNRYKAEFELSGNTITLKNQIGRDTQFMYRYRLNASNIVQEIDASSMWTYAKGYGDFTNGEEDNAALVREYTSPLASIIGIRHAPPIYDGRITDTETMDDSLKSLVDESLQISVTTDVHDLRKQGYPLAQPQLGDRVFLIDERIGLKDEIRVQDISITRDWQGNVLDLKLTIGSQSIRKRHQSDLQTAVNRITQLYEGRAKLPFSVLDNAVAQATEAIRNAQTELQFPSSGGILAVDPDDPNNVVAITSAGVGVSDDGGGTFENAITGMGINASVVTTGTMLADRIAGGILQSLNGNTEFNLNDGKLIMQNTEFELGGGAQILFTSSGNQVLYSLYDSDAGFARVSGMGVGIGNSGYPFAHLGTYSGSQMNSTGPYYSGFTAATTAAISNGGSNSITGNRFQFRNNTNLDKVITLDMFGGATLSWYGLGNFTIGSEFNTVAELYNDQINAREFRVHNPNPSSNYGYVFETTYGDRAPALRARNAQSENYYLGSSGYRWHRIYLRNSPDVSSDERLKEEITDNLLGLDFINAVNTNQFRLKKTNEEDDPHPVQFGIIAQQVIQALDEYGVDVENTSFVNMGDDGMYGVQYEQFIAPLIKAIQDMSVKHEEEMSALIERVEALENGTDETAE